MVTTDNDALSLTKQCQLLSLSRSGFYYESKGENALNLSLMRLIDSQFLQTPYYGSRQMARYLRREGYCVSRKRIRRLMRLMGLKAIYQSPKTSNPNLEHAIYPYLLRGLEIKSQPGVVYRYHLHSHQKRVSLSCGHYGLV